MSDISPKINHGDNDPDDARKRIQKILEMILPVTSSKNASPIINIFLNTGPVEIQSQFAKHNGDITQMEDVGDMRENIQIHATGSVVNCNSTLNDVNILLDEVDPPHGPTDQVCHALNELSEALATVDAKHTEEVILLTRRIEELAKMLVQPSNQKQKGILKMSAKGLKEATEAVGDLVPGLLSCATKVVEAVDSLLSNI